MSRVVLIGGPQDGKIVHLGRNPPTYTVQTPAPRSFDLMGRVAGVVPLVLHSYERTDTHDADGALRYVYRGVTK